ncbi:hypothetical protein [Saccharopolyspora shandongensis]
MPPRPHVLDTGTAALQGLRVRPSFRAGLRPVASLSIGHRELPAT